MNDKETHSLRELERIYDKLKENQNKSLGIRSQNDPNLWINPLNHSEIQKIPHLACIRELEIHRSGSFSCPLSTFIIFISDFYVDIQSEAVQKYNNLYNSYNLTDLHKFDPSIPQAYPLVSGPSFEYRIFPYKNCELKPILWGKFKSESKVVATIRLDEVFSGKYLYVKMICSDNKMAEMQDFSTMPNIDCTYIGGKGLEIIQ